MSWVEEMADTVVAAERVKQTAGLSVEAQLDQGGAALRDLFADAGLTSASDRKKAATAGMVMLKVVANKILMESGAEKYEGVRTVLESLAVYLTSLM